MFKTKKNQKGIALLIVVSFVTIMSTVVFDLLTETTLNHQIAINTEKRMQAYYLAKSSLGFSKLLMYYSKKLKGEVDKAGASSSTLNAIGYQPLYKMFPMSSGLLRGMMSAPADKPASPDTKESDGATEQPGADAETGEDSGGDLLSQNKSIMNTTGMLDQEKLQDFLSFPGDFDSDISEESGRYSLNVISKMLPTSASYDLYKKILLQMLKGPDYKTYFESQERDAESLVHALADWVDTNDTINEFDQVERGNEDSVYTDDFEDVDSFKVKSAKYLTLSEVRLVHGMSDDIFTKLAPLITVYNTADAVNVCLSDPAILEALIVHYTTYSECTTPITADDKDQLDKLSDLVLAACPDKSAMASALNVELGIKTQEDVDATATSGTAEQKSTTSKSSECKVQFEDLITDSNDLFTIKSHGTVDGVQRTITVVLDTSASQPTSWKTLYYHVE